MQLVGATRGFILAPFVYKSAIQGVVSAILAIFMLSGVVYLAKKEFSQIAEQQEFELIAILYLSIIIIGILISAISTYFAVNRYLKLHSDDLYI